MSNSERNAMVIGVTGGIACGKSEVGRELEEIGFLVSDADLVAHDLMKKGTPSFSRVVDHFGECVLSENGEISRPALGNIVFNSLGQRDVLNRIVHPAVKKVLSDWIEECRSDGKNAAVLIPLLFESGMQDLDFDCVVCVSCSEDVVIQRLAQRGLSADEAEKRIRSQMPLAEKEKLADHVVSNIGTRGELKLAVQNAVAAIVKGNYE